MLIGWHFLYEGRKLIQPGGWSSAGYLRMSSWFAAPLFKMIADTPWLLRIVDLVNMWGLTLIGLALIIGILVRPAAAAGILLLAFYYVAQPPFLSAYAYSEGHFLFIDRNVVEAVALLVVMLVPSYGLGSYLASLPRTCFKRSLEKPKGVQGEPVASTARRDLLLSLARCRYWGLRLCALPSARACVGAREPAGPAGCRDECDRQDL